MSGEVKSVPDFGKAARRIWHGVRSGRRAGGRRHSRAMLITGSLAILVTMILIIGSLYSYMKYREVLKAIRRVNVSQDLVQRPPDVGKALNILFIGSQGRPGSGGTGVRPLATRSDAVMVAHISPSLKRMVVLSFPRETAVPVLQCAPEAGTPGQQAHPGSVEPINSTYSSGGPGCLWHTIEQVTQLRINDFVDLTFAGFEKVIDDLGGLDVCLPQPVSDPAAGVSLGSGQHHINGAQALAFWRSRQDVGQTSDLRRIQRNQFLMAGMLQRIKKSGLQRNPIKIASVVRDVAGAMATNTGFTVDSMLQIAFSLEHLSQNSVQFIEVPTRADPQGTGRLQLTSQDSRLFSAIGRDVNLPTISTTKSTPGVRVINPATIKVEVLNGSGRPAAAFDAATGLASRGFDVVGNTYARTKYTRSVIEYALPADYYQAAAVASQLGNVMLRQNPAINPNLINLIVGSSFAGLRAQPTQPSAVTGLTQHYGGITGSVTICSMPGARAS